MDLNTFERIREETHDLEIPAVLLDWLRESKPAGLFRINLKKLASTLGLPLPELLNHFLWMVDRGIFDLSWEIHCPHCNAVPDFFHHFGELKSTDFCPLCDLTFRGILDQNIEVTFTVQPSFVEIPEEIRNSYRDRMFSLAREGRYVLEGSYLSGLECLNNTIFHTLFGDQVLSTEESLEIRNVTILFTDIQGSTAMYTDLGDTRSYEIVREHFKILFKEIEDRGGYVVKTIGDAVMASFMSPVDALRAAVSAYEKFTTVSWEGTGNLQIKMGFHTGSVIAVNLNDRMDYFGNTVNIAARIEGKARDHSVCFTKTVFDRPDVQRFLRTDLRGKGAKIYHRKVELKGIDSSYDFYALKLGSDPGFSEGRAPAEPV